MIAAAATALASSAMSAMAAAPMEAANRQAPGITNPITEGVKMEMGIESDISTDFEAEGSGDEGIQHLIIQV